jgi:predicted ArsR family transcriptional regulator
MAMSEEIGKHKGAVETLLHEKKELSRILNIVNSQLQRHLTALEEEGVDTEEFINDLQEQGQQQRKQQQQQQAQKKQSQNQGEDEFDLSGHLE